MFQSSVFDYVNVLDRAADASWMRNEAIGNNLSNVDTPGYKRQDVAFEDVLKNAGAEPVEVSGPHNQHQPGIHQSADGDEVREKEIVKWVCFLLSISMPPA